MFDEEIAAVIQSGVLGSYPSTPVPQAIADKLLGED